MAAQGDRMRPGTFLATPSGHRARLPLVRTELSRCTVRQRSGLCLYRYRKQDVTQIRPQMHAEHADAARLNELLGQMIGYGT